MKTTITRSQIENAADRAGIDQDEYEVRGRYSGRGMYGATCLGLVTRHPGEAWAILAAHVATVAQDNPDSDKDADLLYALARGQQDSMGLSVIVYWPELELTEDGDRDLGVRCEALLYAEKWPYARRCERTAVTRVDDLSVCRTCADEYDREGV